MGQKISRKDVSSLLFLWAGPTTRDNVVSVNDLTTGYYGSIFTELTKKSLLRQKITVAGTLVRQILEETLDPLCQVTCEHESVQKTRG